MLCRNLEATLVFIDFDRVESKNLLAQAFVKQSVGNATGNDNLEAEGAVQKAKGQLQESVGKGKDAVKSAIDNMELISPFAFGRAGSRSRPV